MSMILKAGMARMEHESKNYEARISALEAENARLVGALEGLLGAPVSWRSLDGPLPLPTPGAVREARAAQAAIKAMREGE